MIKIYINARLWLELKTKDYIQTTLPLHDETLLYIGGYNGGSGYFLDGIVGDYMLYYSWAKTMEEMYYYIESIKWECDRGEFLNTAVNL